MTYHGRILRPTGEPLNGVSTQFKVQIRTPGSENCLLYEEVQTLNMASSGGMFSLTIANGQGTRTDTSGYSIDQVFANNATSGAFTFSANGCAVGTTYLPNTGDGRKIAIFFQDENMQAWEPVPSQSVNYAPMAIQARQVGGFAPNNLLRFDNTTAAQNTTPLNLTQFNNLMVVANGSGVGGSSGGHRLIQQHTHTRC